MKNNTTTDATATTKTGKINSTLKMGFAMLPRRSSTKSSGGESATSGIFTFGRRRKRTGKHWTKGKGKNNEVNSDEGGYRSSSDGDSDISDDSVRLHKRRMSCPEAMMRKAQLQLLAEIEGGLRLDVDEEVPREVTVGSDGFAHYQKRISAPAISITALLGDDSSNNEGSLDLDESSSSLVRRRHQKRRSVAQKELLKANLGLVVAADVE